MKILRVLFIALVMPLAAAFVGLPPAMQRITSTAHSSCRCAGKTSSRIRLMSMSPHLAALEQVAALSSAAPVSAAVHHPSDQVLPVLGSSGIMVAIVGLLYLWEISVEWAREAVCKSLRPVVESVLGEIGGLGFVGLILQTFAPANREFLEELSVKLFGEGEILIESFEFLHTAFFQVGVGFFVAAGAMVAVGMSKLAEIETVEELQVDSSTGACTVTPDKLEKYLPVDSESGLPSVNLWDEILMSTEERAGKVLLMRSRLVEQYRLPTSFRIEKYVQSSFAENLKKLVELRPSTWIYLIPALALANSVDLSHEVVNANSANALASSGFFVSTPWAVLPSLFTVLLSTVWGVWNCWKLTGIKYMLLPRLGTEARKTTILPPPVDVEELRREFDASPAWVRPIESLWARPPSTRYQELFGAAGAAGPELYRNSIKFQSWLCITNIVFFGTQIVPRDVGAVLSGAEVGAPEYLGLELLVYGSFVGVSILQLLLVSPRAFWNFCLIACSDDAVAHEALHGSAIAADDT